MINLIWTMQGITLIFLAFAVALPISFFLPIFGAPFIFLFSDAVLLGMAACIAGLVPVASKITRFMSLILLWVALSLALEAPHLRERVSDLMRGTNRGVHLNLPNQSKVSPTVVSIVGPANPILAARGHKWEVEPDVHMLGVRQSMGRPLINMATTVDLPDILWSRGIEPRIGEKSFPQLTIENRVGLESSELKLVYRATPDQVVATYDRRLPLPMKYPGFSMGSAKSLYLSVFHFNLWRAILGINRPVDLNGEISNFLNVAIGASNQGKVMGGPTRAIAIEQEQVVPVPEGRTVSQVFESTNTSRFRSADENWQWEVCGKSTSQLEFGGPGNSTDLLGLTRSDGSLLALLHHVSPGDVIFAFYCEPTSQNIIAFSRLGSKGKPMLRISTYDSSGLLQSMQMFLLPRWLGRDAFLVPGTWERIGASEIYFQVMERIRWVNENHNEVDDKKSYRLLTLRAK